MNRRHRNEQAGNTYHVMARGVDRRRIFVDDDDYLTYTGLLAYVVTRQGWRLLCHCLMPNHVHLLIETPDTNLASGMQLLHGQYARAFNERHARSGHLFEARYKSPVITSEAGLVRTAGYVVANPVAAVLCKEPEDWPWGSHAMLKRRAPRWLAHGRLVERLADAVGFDCYDDLVASHGREPYEQPPAMGS